MCSLITGWPETSISPLATKSPRYRCEKPSFRQPRCNSSLGEVLRRRGWILLPELFAVFSVQVDRPHAIGSPVRFQSADVDGHVVEWIATRRLSGLVNQVDAHP